MKWVILISLFLCSTVTESRHWQKRDAEHQSRHVRDIYNTVGEDTFDHIVLVILSQSLQQCTLEQQYKVQADIHKIAKHCVDHGDEEECKKPVITLFYDQICKIQELDQKYPFTKECCAKQDPERYTCFKEHRDVKTVPYQVKDIESACKEHKEHPKHAYDHYLNEIAKRHSGLYPPSVLELAKQYDRIVTECCEAEDKLKCFKDQMTDILKKTYYIEHVQEHKCRILDTFPERVTQAKTLAKVSKKYPAATFEDVQKLTLEIVHLHKDCCHGDMVECMIERLELTQHTCDNHEKLSSNLKGCCEKPLIERTSCIISLPNDDAPADLPTEMTEFVEDEHVCKNYEEHKDLFLAKFTYEFARRHKDLAIQSLLRVSRGYEALIQKCCATADPVPCYKTAPQLLEAAIKASHALEQENCAALEKLGPYFYQLQLLYRYTAKMPEVTDPTLIEITGQMTKFGAKCCPLPENQRIPCAEELLDLLLGDMCERQSHTFINDGVRHCCVDSYSDRRPCFTKLGPDTTFKPPSLDENTFHVGADLCDASEEDQQTKKKILLIHLVKLKPTLEQDKLNELINEFSKVSKKCCEEADHKTCFELEKPLLFAHVKAAVEH